MKYLLHEDIDVSLKVKESYYEKPYLLLTLNRPIISLRFCGTTLFNIFDYSVLPDKVLTTIILLTQGDSKLSKKIYEESRMRKFRKATLNNIKPPTHYFMVDGLPIYPLSKVSEEYQMGSFSDGEGEVSRGAVFSNAGLSRSEYYVKDVIEIDEIKGWEIDE